MTARPLHPHVGVEFAEMAGRPSLTDNDVDELRNAANWHGCALVRGVQLEPRELTGIARVLGEPLPPYRPQYSVTGWPEVVEVGNVRKDGEVSAYLNRGGVEWHTDSPGSSHPPGYSMLYCLENQIPDGGGETGFASSVAGYAALPAALRARADSIELIQSFNTFNDQVAAYDGSTVPAQDGDLRERNCDTLDPMVQIHPATGARHLYVSHAMVKAIAGMDLAAGMELIMEVVGRATAPDLAYKHAWRPGDLMIFDNRSCMHTPFPYAYDDFPRTRRLLHQVIVGGRGA
jgi:alpha-ketoglutarate-dependent taurine dioxygenase